MVKFEQYICMKIVKQSKKMIVFNVTFTFQARHSLQNFGQAEPPFPSRPPPLQKEQNKQEDSSMCCLLLYAGQKDNGAENARERDENFEGCFLDPLGK